MSPVSGHIEHCVDCVLQSIERGKYEHEKKNGLISRESWVKLAQHAEGLFQLKLETLYILYILYCLKLH